MFRASAIQWHVLGYIFCQNYLSHGSCTVILRAALVNPTYLVALTEFANEGLSVCLSSVVIQP